MNVHAIRNAQVHLGFRQNSTSSTRSSTQNNGPTWGQYVFALQERPPTFVTKRRKLLDTRGTLNGSRCELNSRTLPGTLCLLLC